MVLIYKLNLTKVNFVCVCVFTRSLIQEEDATEAHGREDASDRRLQQLQTALGQLESRYVPPHHPPPHANMFITQCP